MHGQHEDTKLQLTMGVNEAHDQGKLRNAARGVARFGSVALLMNRVAARLGLKIND
jgi:hypothetical protein